MWPWRPGVQVPSLTLKNGESIGARTLPGANAGELTEGYPAIATAMRFARERGVRPLPLLEMLNAVIWDDADVGTSLANLRLE